MGGMQHHNISGWKSTLSFFCNICDTEAVSLLALPAVYLPSTEKDGSLCGSMKIHLKREKPKTARQVSVGEFV